MATQDSKREWTWNGQLTGNKYRNLSLMQPDTKTLPLSEESGVVFIIVWSGWKQKLKNTVRIKKIIPQREMH